MLLIRLSLFCGILVFLAAGQPPKKSDDKKDPQEKFEPKSGPGTGQKFLSAFVGDWAVEKSFYPRTEGAAPAKSTGICKQEMIHEGRFLRSEFTFDGTAGKTTGTGMIGFEPANGLFTSTWIDSRQTRMSFRRSKDKFDGKEIVLFGVSFEEQKDGRKSKTVTRIEDDGKKIVHKQYSIAADGAERLVMQLAMTKKDK